MFVFGMIFLTNHNVLHLCSPPSMRKTNLMFVRSSSFNGTLTLVFLKLHFWGILTVECFFFPGCHINIGVDTNKYIYIDPNLSLSLHFGCKPPSPVSGDIVTLKTRGDFKRNQFSSNHRLNHKDKIVLFRCFEEGLL